MITGKIDVSKIDKTRLYKGEKGNYLSITLIPTPNGQYGDYMIVEEVTKQEREAGKKGTILGNAKNVVKKSDPAPEASKHYSPDYTEDQKVKDSQEQIEDDLPF